MGTHCQLAERRRSGEHQNLEAVNYFWPKKQAWGGQLQTKDMFGTVAYNVLFVFTVYIYSMKCMAFLVYRKLCRRLWITFVDTFFIENVHIKGTVAYMLNLYSLYTL